jgi:N-carbamoylputrescine amidase
MKIGLVSYLSKNRDISFNVQQIELAFKRSKGKVDLLCFGEAFIQGFDSLCWNYEIDKNIALSLSSNLISQLKKWSIQYGISLITGYIERDQEKLYSSCVVISNGEIVHNYRRISKGWKEYTKTDEHYCEGDEVSSFYINGKEITLAICGDLWEFPNRFKTNHLLIWPIYVNYSIDEWNSGVVGEYAAQAALVANDVLMINPIDDNPINHGGSFYFHNGQTISQIPFDSEEILIVDIR